MIQSGFHGTSCQDSVNRCSSVSKKPPASDFFDVVFFCGVK